MRSRGSLIRVIPLDEVQASLDTFGDGIAAKLDARPPAPGAGVDPAFSYRMLFGRLAAELRETRLAIVSAEDEHVRRLIQVVNLRRESREATAALYDQQVSVRRILTGVYGPTRSFELAVTTGPTPQYGEVLLQQVDQTVKLLREPEVALPSVKVGGVRIDLGEMADDLEAERRRSEAARLAYARARKAANASQIRKNAAHAAYDASFPWIARTLESLFRLAGERELAERIRTSARRANRRGNDASDSAEPTTGSDTAAPAPTPSDS